MNVFRLRENANWNRGPFDRAAQDSSFPKYGIVAETKEEFFDFLRAKGMTRETNEYLGNPGLFHIQSRAYRGSKRNGSKVVF